METLNPNDARPPYLQVAAALKSAISAGSYSAGDKLPPHQAVADSYGVSVGTVKRAYALLQHENVIVTRQGQGSYVRTDHDAVGDRPVPTLAEVASELALLRRRLDAVERTLGRG